MFFKYFICFVIVVLLLSCDKRKRYIHNTIQELYNKEFFFSDSLVARVNGKDTLLTNIFEGKYKILNYIDTTGCTECRLKLYDWKLLKQRADSLDLNVNFIFIYWVNSLKKLEYFQRINGFNYPYLYDKYGIFKDENKLPKLAELHTFLLDSNNRVILVGSPIKNEKMWKLYVEQLRK